MVFVRFYTFAISMSRFQTWFHHPLGPNPLWPVALLFNFNPRQMAVPLRPCRWQDCTLSRLLDLSEGQKKWERCGKYWKQFLKCLHQQWQSSNQQWAGHESEIVSTLDSWWQHLWLSTYHYHSCHGISGNWNNCIHDHQRCLYPCTSWQPQHGRANPCCDTTTAKLVISCQILSES